MRSFLLSVALLLAPTSFADTTTPVYGQVMIHTADGGTYVVTGDMTNFVYKTTSAGNSFVGCMMIDGAIGLPPATNDRIFRDGFDADLCYQE
jgi:hypothetical protein